MLFRSIHQQHNNIISVPVEMLPQTLNLVGSKRLNVKGGDALSLKGEKMERVKRFLRKVAERAKAVLTHKSEGFNDMVMIATAIISVVIVAMIGVYISSQIYEVTQLSTTSPFNTAMNAAINIMNTTFPLITVIVIAVVAGTIMVYLMGGFGVGAGGGGKGEK